MAKHPVELDADGHVIKVKVRKIEEKQSDVNLAARLMLDVATGATDSCFMLTCDTDFAGLLRFAQDNSAVKVGLLTPIDSVPQDFAVIPDCTVRRIRHEHLVHCQLPTSVQPPGDSVPITRPECWKAEAP